MVTTIVLILTIGGVVLLRPLSARLGALLEAMTEERRDPPGLDRTLSRVRESLESLDARLTLLEERQDFTDELLRGGARGELDAGEPVGGRNRER